MAIAHDLTSSWDESSKSSHSFSHTNSGDADGMVASFGFDGGDCDAITGCTYNSVSFTKVNCLSNSRMTQWYLAAPATGANTFALTFDATDNTEGNVSSYEGTDTSDLLGANASTSDSAVTSINLDIVTDTANSWIVDCLDTQTGSSSRGADSPQVERGVDAGTTSQVLSTSDQTTTTATTYNMGWSWTTNSNPRQGIIEIHVGGGAAGPATLKTFDTVAKASIKTINTATIATVKTINTAA